ncbi:MAG: GNAT family N-acetyltransferase [Acidobacteria bacterium]|nr:GNAT family N-acetyltransferase [Acidobacteriota bacterium]
MPELRFRDLHSADEFRQVMDLEQQVWGFTDLNDMVTLPVFTITVKRGAILIGAYDETDRMVGFVYSIVGMKPPRQVLQWSHMLGVLSEYRNSGLGRALKLAQRDKALAQGYELVEWTYDPLQAMNAHLNFTKLGVVAEEYHRNVYGESTSVLHKGTPTDRLVAQWWIAKPHVERRVAPGSVIPVTSHELTEAAPINATHAVQAWLANSDLYLARDERRLALEIPMGFTDMQREAPALALEWRMQTREAFETYFRRGYRVVDFHLDRPRHRGRYLLAKRDD